MTTTTFTYYLVARCPHCQRVANYRADDPADTKATAEVVEEWRAAGYTIDRITKALLWNTPRGCVCLPGEGG